MLEPLRVSPIIQQMKRNLERKHRIQKHRKDKQLVFFGFLCFSWLITDLRKRNGLDPIPPPEWFNELYEKLNIK